METRFALLYTEFVVNQKRWSLPQLVNRMSKAPAKRFKLDGIGEIKEGNDADIILVDMNHEYTIDASQNAVTPPVNQVNNQTNDIESLDI